jgi:hypothetical protein
MKAGHQGVAVAALPGLAGGTPWASALVPGTVPLPPVPVGGQGSAQAGVPAGGAVRPQPIDSGIDGWFLDRLFGRR